MQARLHSNVIRLIRIVIGYAILELLYLSSVTAAESDTIFASNVPAAIPDGGQISRNFNFPHEGKVIAIVLSFELRTECESNHRAELIDPGKRVVSVMDRGSGTCSQTPKVFSSHSTSVGSTQFFGGREARGQWTLRIYDVNEDRLRGRLIEAHLKITMQPTGDQTSPFTLLFPLYPIASPYTATVTAVMDHANERGVIAAFDGSLGKAAHGCVGYNSKRKKYQKCSHIKGAKNFYKKKKYTIVGFKNSEGKRFFKSELQYRQGLKFKRYAFHEGFKGKGHTGYDYQVAHGTLVYAPADGKVVSLGEENDQIVLDHGEYTSHHLHLTPRRAMKVQDDVVRGQMIGSVGNTSVLKGDGQSLGHADSPEATGYGVPYHLTIMRCPGGLPPCHPVDPYGTWDEEEGQVVDTIWD